MKTILFVFALLVAGTTSSSLFKSALKDAKEAKRTEADTYIIGAIIESLLEGLKQTIRDEGYDPFEVSEYQETCLFYEVVSLRVQLDDLTASGITNITINSINFDVSGNIEMDISLEDFTITLGNIDSTINVLGPLLSFNLRGNGRLSLSELNVFLNAGGIDIADGLEIEDLTIRLRVGPIESNVVTILNGDDYSNTVNDFINNVLPQLTNVYGDQIDEVLEVIVKLVLDNLPIDLSSGNIFDEDIIGQLNLCQIIDFVLEFIRTIDF